MVASMKKLLPLFALAGLLSLGGCTGYYVPYAVQYGAWSNYDPYYEYDGYRRSDQPIAWYGPADAPYGHTWTYRGYDGGY